MAKKTICLPFFNQKKYSITEYAEEAEKLSIFCNYLKRLVDHQIKDVSIEVTPNKNSVTFDMPQGVYDYLKQRGVVPEEQSKFIDDDEECIIHDKNN